jgi:hypothetical protein
LPTGLSLAAGIADDSTSRAVRFEDQVMISITHNEVRRHPRWREEQSAPLHESRGPRVAGTRLLGLVGFLIVATASLVLVLRG